MATEKEIGVRLRVTATGLEVIDEAGKKVGEFEHVASRSQQKVGEFGKLMREQLVPTFDTLKTSVVAAGAAVGVGLVGSFALAARGLSDFLERTGRLADLSQTVGVAARDLSSLTLAAKTSGVEMSALGLGLRFLNQNIAQAGAGSKAEAAAFTSLGVAVRDARGQLRSASDVFEDLAGVFETLPDGPQKTALAMTLLGRSGGDLIPVLNQGRDGLRDMRAEAERLGVTLSDEAVRAADDAGDALDLLKLSVQGVFNSVGTELSPAIRDAAQATTEWTAANREAIAVQVADYITGIGRAAADALPLLKELKQSAIAIGSGAGTADLELLPTMARERIEALRRAGDPRINAAGDRGGAGQFGPLTGGVSAADGGMSEAGFADLAQPTPSRASAAVLSSASIGGGSGGGGGIDAAKAATDAQADYEKRVGDTIADQEKVRLALLDAQVSMRERALQFAREDLDLAQRSGASQQDQVRLASQLDDLERQRLSATRDRIQAELDGLQQFGPVVSAEVVQLQDQLSAVNEELARGPRYADELRQKLADASREGGKLEDSFRSAISSLQASGGKVDAAGLLRNVLQIDGADLLAKSLGGLAEKLGVGGKDSSLLDIIGNGASKLFSGSTPSAAPATAPTSVSAAPAAEAAASGAGTQQAIQAGAAAGGAAAAGYAAILLAGIGALQGGFSAISREQKRLGANQQSVLTAGAAGAVAGSFDALGFGGIGDLLSSAVTKLGGSGFLGSTLVNTTLVSPLLTGGVPDPIIGALAPQIFELLGLFQPKTKGSLFKKSLASLFNEAGLPTQREFSGGGRVGVRIPSLEQSANQETFDYLQSLGLGRTGIIQDRPLSEGINANLGNYRGLREETAGVALALAPGTRGAGVFFNAIQNNFALLGQSSEEARRQLLKLATTAGVDLVGGLENLNKKFLQGKITQDALQAGAEGLVQLFTADLPKAIDVAKIIADRTNATGGIDIAAAQAGIRGASAAYDIRQQIDDQRLQRTDPRLQGTEIKRRIADLDRQLGDDTLTLAQREDLLRRRADLGFQYSQYADSRFSGSQRTRETEYGYRVAEDTAKQLEQLGIDLKEPTEANTDATKNNSKETNTNTAAIKGLTAALLKGIKADATLTVAGLDGADAESLTPELRKILRQLLREPEFRGAVQREAAR